MKRHKISDRIKITREKEIKARENLENTPLEKNDLKAMIIAAFLMFGVPTVVLLGILAFIMWFIFFVLM